MNNLEKEVRSSVGYYCKIFREDMGCTQKEVAIATGKSRRLISHFEHGESDNINVFCGILLMDCLIIMVKIYLKKYMQ